MKPSSLTKPRVGQFPQFADENESPKPEQMIPSSMKKVRASGQEMLEKPMDGKNKYQNVQLKQFMNSLLNDEIYVPLNTSPLKTSTKFNINSSYQNFAPAQLSAGMNARNQ